MERKEGEREKRDRERWEGGKEGGGLKEREREGQREKDRGGGKCYI